MTKADPVNLAHQFMDLNVDDFRMFWTIVGFEWDQEDGDIEEQWFHCGKTMRPTELAVISAMHSAVASGQKSAARDRSAS